jgi:hypothetical protein
VNKTDTALLVSKGGDSSSWDSHQKYGMVESVVENEIDARAKPDAEQKVEPLIA